MSGEGLSKLFSAEWIRAVSTAIPVVLAMFWVLKLQGHLWRRVVWQRVGAEVRAVAARLDGTIEPRWLGYEVRTERVRVAWLGGLRGEVTVIRLGTQRTRHAGWLACTDVTASGQLDAGSA